MCEEMPARGACEGVLARAPGLSMCEDVVARGVCEDVAASGEDSGEVAPLFCRVLWQIIPSRYAPTSLKSRHVGKTVERWCGGLPEPVCSSVGGSRSYHSPSCFSCPGIPFV